MNLKPVIISQYLASLEMMKKVVKNCPESLWISDQGSNQFWHIAYHALFYSHLYLAPTEDEFIPWSKHKDSYQYLGAFPWPPYEKPEISGHYIQRDILDYIEFCKFVVEEKTKELDLEAKSGFDWLPMNKIELQFYNIRHLQQHIGELCERLWAGGQIEIDWVGMQPDGS